MAAEMTTVMDDDTSFEDDSGEMNGRVTLCYTCSVRIYNASGKFCSKHYDGDGVKCRWQSSRRMLRYLCSDDHRFSCHHRLPHSHRHPSRFALLP